MVLIPTSAALNHLLAQNSWAMRRLEKFTGKTIQFNITPFSFAYVIQPDGSVLTIDSTESADVACNIAPSLIPRLALREESAYSEIGHEGDKDLFSEIITMVRELRWDVVEDLSHFTGDIAAERIAQAMESSRHQLHDAVNNLSEATAEYLIEERPLLVKPQQIAEFHQQVQALRKDVMQLEQKINHLLDAGRS